MKKIQLLKMLDRIVGMPACALFPRHGSGDPDAQITLPDTGRILVIRPGGIGDAVLLIPVIRILQKELPGIQISVLAEKRNAEVFCFAPIDSRDVYCYDDPTQFVKIFRRKFNVIIDTEQWHRFSALTARLLGADAIIGYATNERSRLLTHRIQYEQDAYETDNFRRLLQPFRLAEDTALHEPFLTVPDTAVNAMRSRLSFRLDKKMISLFPGSSIPERRWGIDRFRQLAIQLIDAGHSILVVGGREDRYQGELISRGLRDAFDATGRLTLPETTAALSLSSLLVTADSGIMHVAFGVGTRIVALFGPGRENKWAPRSSGCVTLNKRLACSPCTTFGYTKKCKKDAVCMSSISVQEVFTTAQRLLASASCCTLASSSVAQGGGCNAV